MTTKPKDSPAVPVVAHYFSPPRTEAEEREDFEAAYKATHWCAHRGVSGGPKFYSAEALLCWRIWKTSKGMR